MLGFINTNLPSKKVKERLAFPPIGELLYCKQGCSTRWLSHHCRVYLFHKNKEFFRVAKHFFVNQFMKYFHIGFEGCIAASMNMIGHGYIHVLWLRKCSGLLPFRNALLLWSIFWPRCSKSKSKSKSTLLLDFVFDQNCINCCVQNTQHTDTSSKFSSQLELPSSTFHSQKNVEAFFYGLKDLTLLPISTVWQSCLWFPQCLKSMLI